MRDDTTNYMSVSFDGAWQKRGSGRCYNSRTGHATMVGENTGKCTDYGVKSTDCRKCLFTNDPSDHDCRKNFAGSSKSMEAAIAVDLVSHVMDLGYRVKYITMDEDTTTISRIKASVDPNVQKKSDKNHIKKILSNSLFDVKQKHKMLIGSVISYFVKCASYAISQYKDSQDLIKKNLLAIVPHAFGSHEECDSSWCGYLSNPDKYKHNELPGGFDLTDENLRLELEHIFKTFADKSDKLVNCGSSQPNESTNQIITTKAPKSKHFGGSESLNFKVAAGVAQKNAGSQYVVVVNEIQGLSPGKVTVRRNEILDAKRKRKKQQQMLPSNKRMRKRKKAQHQIENVRNETKEGPTYVSAIGIGPHGDNADITKIPDPKILKPCSSVASKDAMAVVVFDLETTGFGNDTEIVQLAASCEAVNFNKYILPKNQLHPKAAEVTQLYSTGSRLYHKGQPVKTETTRNVLLSFIEWLPNNALLVAHNCKNFDANVLVSHVEGMELYDKFNEKVLGFADTLPLFKVKLQKRKSYSQTSLASNLLGATYDAHNAIEDVSLLRQLLNITEIKTDELIAYSFGTEYVKDYLAHSRFKKINLTTFNGFIRTKVMTKNMCDKAAASGLTLEHLKFAFERNGSDGVSAVLGELTETQKPRVTKQKAVVKRICEYFSK